MLIWRASGFQRTVKAIRNTSNLLWLHTDGAAKRFFAFAIVFMLGTSVLIALAPISLKFIVDGLAVDAAERSATIFVLFILAYVAIQWLARTFGELRWYVYGRAEQRVNRRLSGRLFMHIMTLPLRFHLERKTGALNQTLANGLLGYRMVLHHVVFSVLPAAVEIATMSLVLVLFGHPIFIVVLTVSVAAYTAAFVHGAARILGPARAVSSAHINATAMMTDSVINYEMIKYFDAESHVYGRYDDTLRRTEAHWNRFYKTKTVNGLILATIFALSLSASTVFATWEVLRGSMTVGDFVLVNTYMLQIVRPLEMLGFAFRDTAQGVAFIEKMLDLLRQEPESRRINGTTGPAPTGPSALVFDRVSFAYRPDRPILKDVSFTVPSGGTVAIVGPSGSGKSSLIRLLMRLYEPDSGQVLLDGMPLSQASPSAVRRTIAVVPQDTVLFNDTIAYNIDFGKPSSSLEEIKLAARVAHLHDFIASLPDGYDTIVGERGLKLSGGERQRMAIARAALKRPRVFVFDEATSSLDTNTEQEILRSLVEVSRTTTTLIIAHRLSTVVHVDEIVVLTGGEIVEQGSHEALLAANGHYAAMWRAQNLASCKNEN